MKKSTFCSISANNSQTFNGYHKKGIVASKHQCTLISKKNDSFANPANKNVSFNEKPLYKQVNCDETKCVAKYYPESNTNTEAFSKKNLMKEAIILKKLENSVGFQKMHKFVKVRSNELILMNVLGPNLEFLMSSCGGKFSLKSVLMIGIQGVQRLEELHKKGILHRDIKPRNFAIGVNEKSENTIHLTDFWLANPYLDEKQNHISLAKHMEKVNGAAVYYSINEHFGLEASRRDDLISFGYMLIHLVKGELPWMKVQEGNFYEKIKTMNKMKASISHGDLCKGLPKEFVDYFNTVFNLSFNSTPNYSQLGLLFEKMLKDQGFKNDGIFDWIAKPEKTEKIEGIDLNGRKIGQPLTQYMKSFTELEEEEDE